MIDSFEISKELLNQNGQIIGTTKGNSMTPLFRSGKDKALIVPITAKLKIGDVLLYKSPNSTTVNLHRIVAFKDNHPIFRGDSLFFKETNIPKTDILGILKGFWRDNKYYDCEKNTLYRIYVFYILLSYPIRRLMKKINTAFKKLKNLLEK